MAPEFNREAHAGHAGRDPAALDELITGSSRAQLVYVAAKLGLADLLRHEPRDSASLAAATGAHPHALRRVLRGLALLGVLDEAPDGRFGLTPMGQGLRSDLPDSWRGWALLWGGPYGRAYGGLLHTVMTGETAFDAVAGMRFFDYLALHPAEAAAFDGLMSDLTAPVAAAIAASYDFSGVGTVVDVGGGKGTLLSAILGAYPALSGVLFDQPPVLAAAPAVLAAAGVADRCRIVGGNFFAMAPEGGDLYVLKWILHDWEAVDERRAG